MQFAFIWNNKLRYSWSVLAVVLTAVWPEPPGQRRDLNCTPTAERLLRWVQAVAQWCKNQTWLNGWNSHNHSAFSATDIATKSMKWSQPWWRKHRCKGTNREHFGNTDYTSCLSQIFNQFWVLRLQEVVMPITFVPPKLPYTDSPPPRWSPARPCGWPEWSNSAPRTWSRTGMPRGCQERWCAGCRCPPAPRWYSWGRAKSSSPEKRYGRGLNTDQESAFTLTSAHLGRF